MNLWATAAQAVVYTVATYLVRRSIKRTMHRDRQRIERLLAGYDIATDIATSTFLEKNIMSIDLKRFRKAFAAGFGIILIGLLTWASSDGVLASLLEPIVPDAFKPLIGVLVGGIATVVAVIRTSNAPTPQQVILDNQAATVVQTPAARVYVPANTSETSIVPLLPAPEPSYM